MGSPALGIAKRMYPPVVVGPAQAEAQVWVLGFRPLRITCVSLAIHGSRPVKC
ncbi:hypothetical protein HAX54_053506, partial [Datura stramonium]|nr:hypothetical protein [Datura stramonium]